MSGALRFSLRAGAAIFAVVSGLHLSWAAGGHNSSSAVIPERDGKPMFEPTRMQTAGVAVLTAAAGAMYTGTASRRTPTWFFRIGTGTAGAVMAARAIGNGTSVGITKTIKDTQFARLDTRYFTPLCAALGVVGLVGAIVDGRAATR